MPVCEQKVNALYTRLVALAWSSGPAVALPLDPRRWTTAADQNRPSRLTGTVRSARRNFRRGAHAAQCEGVTYNVQLWPNQLGKLIEGDLRVDVDETELEFLGLDELLPTEEFGTG